MRRSASWLAPLAFAAVLVPHFAHAQDVAAFYEENCAACHTIGGGAQGGPDLKDALAHRDRVWLTRFILDPEGVVASGDPYAKQIVQQWEGVVMPATEGLTHEMAESLLDYIAATARGGTAPAPADERPFTAEDVGRGRELFAGRRALTAGGAACVSCHDLSGDPSFDGGALGPDLAGMHRRLGGRRGVTTWLTRPPTPLMRALYRRQPLTADETHALAALFDQAASTATAPAAPARRLSARLALSGVAGLIVGLTLIGGAWTGRLRGVRRRVVAAARIPTRVPHGGVSAPAGDGAAVTPGGRR